MELTRGGVSYAAWCKLAPFEREALWMALEWRNKERPPSLGIDD